MVTILVLSLSGSVLALVLLALRYGLLQQMPSTVYYYAWLLVLLRFLLPLPGLIPSFAREAVSPPVSASAAPLRETRETFSPSEGAVSIRPQAVPVQQPAVPTPEPKAETSAVHTAAAPRIDWRSDTLWLCVWAAGACLSFALTLIAYFRFTRGLRAELHRPGAELRAFYASLPGAVPALYLCTGLKTPLMCGVLRPRILLPDSAYDEATLTNILRHELTHYRRRDTLYKWFSVAVLSLHWFNPLTLLIRREISRACELSCDEMLLRTMDRAQKQAYGETLLRMAASAALPMGVVATTFSTEKRNLKERLEQIMHYKKSGARVLAAVLALTLLAGCGAAAGPTAEKAEKAAQTEPPEDGAIHVSTVDELLTAIGPNTVIELAAGVYDLSSAADYGEDTHSACYSWNGVYDGFELALHNVENLTLRGAGKGETVISAMPRYANVLRATNCPGLRLEGLTAGHTAEPGWCQGGVLYFELTDSALVENCGLYGCGTIGVQAHDCASLTVKGSDIYACSYGAIDVHQCRDVLVSGCDIYDHGTREGQGEAMQPFSASYSEGFTVYSCRIHDNRAQYLLNSNYTKNTLFLSNDVTGNAFVAGVFAFQQYGATVDGCRFEGNDVRGGWYRGNGIFASDLDGNALEGAVLAEMVLRDIPPERVAPIPAALAETTEVPVGASIIVKTVDDFLAAIGPDRSIILDGELFDLSAASNYGGIGSDYYYWKESPDGPELVIHDAPGLSIGTSHNDRKGTTLAAIPRYANVLSFRDCDRLQLMDFTAGHSKEPGSCSGGVLHFQNCNDVMMYNLSLYGCGILGIQASSCTKMAILRTEIYECSQGAVQFFHTDGIAFDSCDVHDVPSPAFRFTECGDMTWNSKPINALHELYDMDENWELVEVSYPRDETREYRAAVGDLDNPYAAEPTVTYTADTPQVVFASWIQQHIADDDWAALADRIAFPLQVFTDGSSFVINDRKAYMDMVQDGYFTNEVFENSFHFRQRIADADASVFASCLFGSTCLDHLIAFCRIDSAPEQENLMINVISIVTPLWPGRVAVDDVPPTPQV